MFIQNNLAALGIVFSDPLISIIERKHSRYDKEFDSIESLRRHGSDSPLRVDPPIVVFLMGSFIISRRQSRVRGQCSNEVFHTCLCNILYNRVIKRLCLNQVF